MTRFHVALSWRTTSGTLASCGLVIVARDMEEAISRARSKVTRDARRRYEGRMNARAVPLP